MDQELLAELRALPKGKRRVKLDQILQTLAIIFDEEFYPLAGEEYPGRGSRRFGEN